jgi:hypothetical protein
MLEIAGGSVGMSGLTNPLLPDRDASSEPAGIRASDALIAALG